MTQKINFGIMSTKQYFQNLESKYHLWISWRRLSRFSQVPSSYRCTILFYLLLVCKGYPQENKEFWSAPFCAVSSERGTGGLPWCDVTKVCGHSRRAAIFDKLCVWHLMHCTNLLFFLIQDLHKVTADLSHCKNWIDEAAKSKRR